MAAPSAPRFVAFTDGSSLVNPGGPGGTGFVVLDRVELAVRFGGTRWVDDGPSGVTNNRMELRSVLDALDGIPDGEAVLVTSDSRYVIDALTRWIQGWRRKGWRTSTGGAVLNRDLIETISAREESLRVRYAWVRGHVGHPVNEICDALASAAARRTPGPAADDVFAALRAERLLGDGEVPRVATGGFGAPRAEPRRRGQLDLGF
jgi:ribonuclease HI